MNIAKKVGVSAMPVIIEIAMENVWLIVKRKQSVMKELAQKVDVESLMGVVVIVISVRRQHVKVWDIVKIRPIVTATSGNIVLIILRIKNAKKLTVQAAIM